MCAAREAQRMTATRFAAAPHLSTGGVVPSSSGTLCRNTPTTFFLPTWHKRAVPSSDPVSTSGDCESARGKP